MSGMQLHNLNGQVYRFDPDTGKTWVLGHDDSAWVPIVEPPVYDDDDDEEDDDEDLSDTSLMRYERVPGTSLMVPPATMAVLAPLLERGITLEHCVVDDNDLPGIYSGFEHPLADKYEGAPLIKPGTWRELLGMGAAPETTQGTIPTADPVPDTRGTVRFIGQRKAVEDEKPATEPDYRDDAAWE